MKSFEPQFRFRKLIALSALLPYLTVGNFTCVWADDWKAGTSGTVKTDSKAGNSGTVKTDSKAGNSGTVQTDSKAGTSGTVKTDSKAGNSGTVKTDSKAGNSGTVQTDSKAGNSGSVKSDSKAAPLFAPPGKAQIAPLPSASDTKPAATNSGTTGGAPSPGNSVGTNSNPPATGPGPFRTGGNGVSAAADGNKVPGGDSYPSVGRMERLTFGSSLSDSPIEQRLTKLETAIYQKSFADLSLFDRTQQLKKTLLGNDDEPTADIDNLRVPSNGNWLGNPSSGLPFMTDQPSSEFDYFGGIAQRPENQQTTTPADMKEFFLELINSERSKSGLSPLAPDPLAEKLAQEQNDELCKRSVISHANSKGENPDRRYTIGGGTGALTESLVSNKTPDTFSKSPTRAAVAELMKTLMSRQDDRDAILNQDATHIGLAINWTANRDKIIAVTEVVTNHGIIPELPHEVGIGEKLEIKGVVMQPYQFDRITLAWEANKGLSSAPDEAEEALPYFPPLDYVAYAGKSAHDYSGAVSALRTAGVIAAIAGGIFMPPVALAAPLIAMSGGVGTGDPKPVSDIPIHGGVKVEGLTFNGKVPINKDGKEGIYYVTIWGTLSKLGKSVPISRRAILAKHVDEDVSAKIETPADEATSKDKDGADDKDKKKKEKHHHKDKWKS
ncbi:MAG: CAP domain-containing protein [Candidatus Melainabacteria bacterium]|nr:CAP domain-containing protein [Candidatus Melainabacteria bacterium]